MKISQMVLKFNSVTWRINVKLFIYFFKELAEIKMQLESSMGKEEFARQISRQRSQLSESQSQLSEGAGEARSPNRSLSRYCVKNAYFKSNQLSNNYNLFRSGSTTSMEKSGEAGLRRRSSAKERSKSQSQEAAPSTTAPSTNANTKLIEAERAETGKVNR